MTPQISQDFERLSAYIDNQLTPAEKAALEARLAQEPQLRAGLDDLRRTVLALRNLPPVKPPRSFTLTPEQAGVRTRRGPLFSTLRLAAALCTLLLVVTVGRDLATNGSLSASVSNHAITAGSAATPLTLPQAAELPSLTPEGNDQYLASTAPAGAETPATDINTTPMIRMGVIQPSATPGPTLKGAGPSETPPANTSGGGSTSPGVSLPAPTSTLASDGTVQAYSTAEVVGTPEVVGTSDVAGTPEETAVSLAAQVPASTDTAMPDQSIDGQATTPAPVNPWRLVEIGLAVLALVLAGATWLTRRG